MDPNTDMTADAVADEALSPSATESTPSSGVADQEPKTLADALSREFAEKYGDAEPGAEEPAEGEGEPAEATAEAEPESEQKTESDDSEDDQHRLSDDEFRALSPKAKQRIGHLNARAKRAERELSEVNKALPQYQQSHEALGKIQTFVRDNSIEPQNVTKMFDMAAMLAKGDYEGFLETVKPFYEFAAQAAGRSIAQDLQQQVEEGYLTEAHARELTRARVQSQTYRGQAEQARQQAQQVTQQQSQAQETQRMVAAITQREAQFRTQDPDYARKEPFLRSMIQLALESGAQPRTAEEAVRMVERAYAQIPAMAAPKPAATPPRPGASSPPRGNAQPKTSVEALEQALSAMPQ